MNAQTLLQWTRRLSARFGILGCLTFGMMACGGEDSTSNIVEHQSEIRGGTALNDGELPESIAFIYGPGLISGPVAQPQPIYICSGTMISARVMLTAGHCAAGAQAYPMQIKVGTGGFTETNAIEVAYRDDEGAYDVGLILLQDAPPLPSNYVPPIIDFDGEALPDPGELLHVTGYGLPNDADQAGTGRRGTMEFEGFGTLLNDQGRLSMFSKPGATNQIQCPGDSGGAYFADLVAPRRLIGVVSAGNSPTCNPVTQAYGASVAVNAQWIRDTRAAMSLTEQRSALTLNATGARFVRAANRPAWLESRPNGVHSGYHALQGAASHGSFVFDADAGRYAVQLHWMAGPNRATQVPLTITTTDNLGRVITRDTYRLDEKIAPRFDAPVNEARGFQTIANIILPSYAASNVIVSVDTIDTNGLTSVFAARLVRLADAGPGARSYILDNSTTTYSLTGSWNTFTGQGYRGGSINTAGLGNGSSIATWELSKLAPGTYQVQASWSAASNLATNATYSVFDGNTVQANSTVNQRVTPGSTTVNGPAFQTIGVVTINSGSLRVELRNTTTGAVMADAIRVVPVN